MKYKLRLKIFRDLLKSSYPIYYKAKVYKEDNPLTNLDVYEYYLYLGGTAMLLADHLVSEMEKHGLSIDDY